ncbi:hypothetical protein Y032_0273g973 [Ancylostoma ceylanicum]|uniref:Uncharacterized protein n=1 Tax=Ancylostoma ceylanicum TaxID=53326 RepID=A0A016S8G9_9BILA|nr:hypothetical protein Y032_0273g973 [Ancylostoma ceylanicum]
MPTLNIKYESIAVSSHDDAICYPIKTYPRIYESARFNEGYLYPIDFHLITFHDLLHLHFVLCLVKTPHLRQEMNKWMDELYWIAEWIKTSGNGYTPAAFFLPRSNILDTAPGFLMFSKLRYKAKVTLVKTYN